MPLRLTIENIPSLPDGGPVSYSITGKRGLDIGRDQYLDWVLPDPNRVVSGKHCEVRYRDGGYWLRDVSTNGTFVNRSERRLQEPHRLRNGDRIEIGHYIINVAIDGEENGEAATGGGAPESMWGVGGGAAPPIDPRDLKPANIARPLQSMDVLDWVASVPEPVATPYAPQEAPGRAAPPPAEDVWGNVAPAAPAPPAAPPPAAPRAWDEAPPAAPPHHPVHPQPGFAPAPQAPPETRPPEPAPMPVDPGLAMPRAAPLNVAPPMAPLPAMPAMERPPQPQPAMPPAARPLPSSGADVIARFAKGLGLPDSAIATRDPGELAEQLGMLMKIIAGNLTQLLAARAESKGAMRSANQTLVQAADNNPLRFAPTPEDALGILFGKPTRSYLDARRAFEQSFSDLKSHQVDSFAAIQQAIQQLVADLDPREIEKAVDEAKSSGLFSNRKVQLWDNYLLRWKMKAGRHESGLMGAFMQSFAEAYDKRKR